MPERRFIDVPPKSAEKTSALLRRVLAELPMNDVPLDYLTRQLRRRSFGGIVMLLALLGLLPGISLLAGLIVLVPGFQMLIGFPAPILPRIIRERTLEREQLCALGDRIIPWIERIERYVRPRWLTLLVLPLPQIVGLTVLCLGILLTLPIPFSNFLPAFALLCLSLGLLERDGLVLCLGLAIAVVAMAISISIAGITFDALMFYIGNRTQGS